MTDSISDIEDSVAIIGMSGRFPGAKNLEEFWYNLKNGVEAIRFFSEQELIEAGIDPILVKEPNYVKAKGVLDNVAGFDAAFFGFSPTEAEITDPQQRLFLECAWEALENAGYDPKTYSGAIGVYGGVGVSSYLLQNLYANSVLKKTLGNYQILINNDKDFLCTRVSYKLNLGGPSVTVQTACSTSLVAVVMGCQSLLEGQCDMVLAGGVAISLPAKSGYLYQEGMIMSPDGHCRAFDAKAQGTVGGNGVGIVVLKRLEDALNDGDYIHAIIKGATINNDGALKVGYTAPSVEAQTRVITEALGLADISPETIRYVEAHGTGTPLGDPIEIAALTQAFRVETNQKEYCAIGSVKTNIGHLDAAAGVVGLIKTVLALEHQLIPPSLHFATPNPKIDFANSPFYVNTKLSEWQTEGTPRRASVSSFGIGGTNAHVILEQAPEPKVKSQPPKSAWQLLLLSARTESALETATIQLLEHLKQHPDLNWADVAYTYQVGRSAFNQRCMLVCQSLADAIKVLETRNTTRLLSQAVEENEESSLIFMFSGQGAQYVNMGLELYQSEPVFQEQVDRCVEFLQVHQGIDLRKILYPPTSQEESYSSLDLQQTAMTQPALFVIEYALAQLWMTWGVQPKAMIGHSIGEYVAACLAGVFTLEEALVLVAERGQLMQSVAAGAMLAVPLSEQEIRPLLNNNIDLAAINVPSQCVVSGTIEAIEQFAIQLSEQGLDCQRLHTSHAFHSEMMVPILMPFFEKVQKIHLKPPQIPFISNVTGTWIDDSDATDPNYWVKHLRQTVRFAAGLQQIFTEFQANILLEIGPGRTLSTFAKRHPGKTTEQLVLTSLRHPKDEQSDRAFFLETLGKLWMAGLTINWSEFYADEQRSRLPLPSYPFERQRYWIEPKTQIETIKSSEPKTDVLRKKPDMADWFYIPSWKRTALPAHNANALTEASCWLVFTDECGLSSQLIQQLQQNNQKIITVKAAEQFTHNNALQYTVNPQQREDYETLLKELLAQNQTPKKILHFWNVTTSTESTPDFLEKSQNLGFYSLLFLVQTLGKLNITDSLQIGVVSNHTQAVMGNEVLRPEKATLLGTCRIIPQEYPNITCRSIDVVLPATDSVAEETLIEQLLSEVLIKSSDTMIAYRDNHRWVQTFEPIHLEKTNETPRLRKQGVYLITGGLGGIGFTLAEYLAKTVQAKLILTMRSSFPDRNEWESWLANHSEQDNLSGKIRQIQTIESLGAEVLIIRADVANLEQMQTAITQSLKQFGQIHGVIHTAGVPGGGVIQRKTREIAESVMAPKVKGTWVLDALLKDMPLDFLVLCSSLTAILGTFGQVDYCAANAFLDAFAHYKANQDLSVPQSPLNRAKANTFTVSILWDGWQKVGMAAAKSVSVKQPLGTVKLSQTPPEKEITHPLFSQCIVEGTNQEIYITRFNVLKHWVLNEHRIMGKPTLPGTAYLEMARAAVENHIPEGSILEIKEIYFLAPLMVEPTEEKEVRTILTKQENESFEFVILSQSNSDNWQEHARGQIICIEAEAQVRYELKDFEEKCQEQEVSVSQDALLKNLEGFITFGPRWRNNLKQIKFGPHQGLALLELPETFSADLEEYQIHPALMDGATAFLSVKNKGSYLPFSYKKLRIKGQLPAKIYSYITFQEDSQAHHLKFNIKIMDEQGNGLVEIEEYTLRKINTEYDQIKKQPTIFQENQNFHLEIASPGLLDTLTFRPAIRQKPGPDEVEIEVGVAGLNFKEVLLALSMFSTQQEDAPVQFGLECAGKIVALGENVKDFQIGDEVIALANASFSAYTIALAEFVMPKPEHLSLEEATTIPVAFLTAYYALHYLARLCRGEKVLIHAAAGGVGLAAVQIAQMIGAEIFATAGNPEKREFLHSLGIKHVMDSRTLDFADIIMKHTHDQGVDVVLNSLAGEFIPKSLSVLGPFGRFLEMGIRDIYENTPLGLRHFEKSLSFFAINVGLCTPHLSSLFKELMQHFQEKQLSPLPHQVFPITEVSGAFEYMARAKHIGKILVSLQNKSALKTLGSEVQTTHRLRKTHSQINTELPAQPTIEVNRLHKELEEGLLPAEGTDVFSRILGNTKPQVLVSTRDLPARLEKNTFNTTLNSLTESAPLVSPKSVHQRPQLSHSYVPPRNALEHKMTDIWKKFLGIKEVGIYDDFFELGGDSLMAIQLISELRRTLQVELSAQSLLETPTIAALSHFIQPNSTNTQNNQKQVLPPSLVEIQPGHSSKQPLLLVHPAGGQVYFYRDLAYYLGSDQPVYGLQAQGVDGKTQPLTQIKEMATHYIKAIRTVYPKGPYALGGSSLGGAIAFEMAQQLHTLGQQIVLLVLIDTPSPSHLPVQFKDDLDFLAYLLIVGDNNLSVSLEQARQFETEELMKYLLEQGKVTHKLPSEMTLEQFHHILSITKIHLQSLWDYKPQPYPGRMIFFRALEREAFNPHNPEQEWLELAEGGMEVHEVPGNHITMNYPPHVEVMAERLRKYLNNI